MGLVVEPERTPISGVARRANVVLAPHGAFPRRLIEPSKIL